MIDRRTLWLIAVGLAWWSIFWFGIAFAHDHSRPDLDQWYKSLTNANGIGCCEDQEAIRVEDADWQSACVDGECHYQVFLANRWWDVPEWAVVKEPNKVGVTLVWPVYYWNNGKPEDGLHDVFIRCFEPGAGG